MSGRCAADNEVGLNDIEARATAKAIPGNDIEWPFSGATRVGIVEFNGCGKTTLLSSIWQARRSRTSERSGLTEVRGGRESGYRTWWLG